MNRHIVFAYPGDLSLRTGGYGYDRRVIQGLAALGWTVEPLALGEGFPCPNETVLREAEQRLSALPDGSLVIIDGLAFGVLQRWAETERQRLRIIALVHHPLALETGLSAGQAAAFRSSETQALACARTVIVTSQMTARELSAHYGVPPDNITVAIPGTDPASGPRFERNDGAPVRILSVGTLTRRKGHDLLLQALKLIEDLSWDAKIVGSRTLDARVAEELAAQVKELGLCARVSLPGECEDTRTLMRQADIFALASRYEGFGMVFAEALAEGLPVVGCRAGAVPEVVPEDAGILVPVDDPEAIARALRSLICDTGLRSHYAEGAHRAGALLPDWIDTARRISAKVETVQ